MIRYDLPASEQRLAIRKPHHFDGQGSSIRTHPFEPLAQPQNGAKKSRQLRKQVPTAKEAKRLSAQRIMASSRPARKITEPAPNACGKSFKSGAPMRLTRRLKPGPKETVFVFDQP